MANSPTEDRSRVGGRTPASYVAVPLVRLEFASITSQHVFLPRATPGSGPSLSRTAIALTYPRRYFFFLPRYLWGNVSTSVDSVDER